MSHTANIQTEAVWREYHSRLHSFILRRVPDRDSADDILQDVFLKIHSKIDTLSQESLLGGWIFRITRNAIIDYYRSRKETNALNEDTLAAEEVSQTALQELAGCLQPMIDALPDHYRDAVVLAELEGKTQKEVGELSGLTLSGAKSRVQRGREKLKELLMDCCHFEFDSRNGLVGYERKPRSCKRCC